MSRILFAIEITVYAALLCLAAPVAVSVASDVFAPAPEPVAHAAGGTQIETLCIEGYLPDGTWWECGP